VAIFFAAGATAINFWTFSPYDLFKTLTSTAIRGAGLSRWASAGLYGIELPSVVSLPVFLLATAGAIGLTRRLLTAKRDSRFLRVMLVAVIPLAASLWPILFTIDHYARHLLVLVPWISMAAAWSLCRASHYLSAKGLHPALVMTPVFLYLCVFVYDGERVFWNDPRNRAAEWLLRNVKPGESVWWWEQGFIPAALGYKHMRFPAEGRPSIILIEMHYANHYLSGMGWRDSYPRDYRKIFMAQSQAQVDQLQSLFRGTSEYRERARFREGYFMPEYTVADRLIGNRARNYVAEIVIFERATEDNATGSAAPTPVP